MKVTVIIPVYNSEKHLRQCIDSVLSQTLEDIEVICVDDGSTDSSFEILNEYAQKDSRLTAFKQKNSRCGVARNNGLKHAQGEYVIFWDSDDYFEPQALEKMYAKAISNQADVCLCGSYRYFEDTGERVPAPSSLRTNLTGGQEVFNRFTHEKYIFNISTISTINKLIRRQFILDNDICFSDARFGEDIIFSCNCYVLAERLTFVDEYLVTYRINQTSSLTGSQCLYPRESGRQWSKCALYLKKRGLFFEQSFENRLILSLMHDLRNLREREAFLDAVRFIKQECLDDLSIKKREKDYYYNENVALIADHLLDDEPEVFYDFLFYYHFSQIRLFRGRLSAAINDKRQNVKRLKRQKAQLNESKKIISDLTERNSALSDTLKRIRKKLKNREMQLEDAETKLRNVEKQLSEQRKQMDEIKKDRDLLQSRLEKINKSFAYRLSRLLTWLPRKIAEMFAGSD
ncbi:MAG: glycosyltransferase [Erysipelotrichaceae bacterium]|nr:glycosyltransferase [Erysipelotrichaceae bacterium]